jgi:protein-tyrosine phosphatase
LDPGREDGKKLLFVCTANVCRSPMAEAIFQVLAAESGLAYEAHSAGVAALVSEPIAPRAREALEEIGVFADDHRARQVDEAMLEDADLVLTMTAQHAATLRRLSESTSSKVDTLLGYTGRDTEGVDIPDPYGQSLTAHRASVRQLLKHISLLCARLKEQR